MQHGISGEPVLATLRYAAPINLAASHFNVSPLLCYAIAYRETIHGEVIGLWESAATVVSEDYGHGLFQITTPPYPPGWADPYINACDAISRFIVPAMNIWVTLGFEGYSLVKLVADTFNEGYPAAMKWHMQGDADAGTTNHYGRGVVAYYNALVNGTDLEAVAS